MNKRLKALLLAAIASAVLLITSSCGKREEVVEEVVPIVTVTKGTYEHSISVPLLDSQLDIRDGIVQYKYHPGYDVVGIGGTGYGRYNNKYGGGSIVYTNNEPVECTSNVKDEKGNYVFANFGIPESGVEYNNDTPTVKQFGVGEHIISAPFVKDNRGSQEEIPYHEGYKVVGIADTAYGRYSNKFGGGVILYVNTVPVLC